MVLVEFNRPRFKSEPLTVFEKPYFRAVIDAKDHTQIYRSDVNSWSQSTPLYSLLYPNNNYGTRWIGLNGTLPLTSGTVSKTINIEETGLYQVKVRCLANPWQGSTGSRYISFKIDGTQKGESIDLYSPWTSERYVDFGIWNINSGNRTFSIELLNRDTWVHEILLYKINRYSSDAKRAKERLDIKTATWTQNTVNELNTAELDLYMQDDFFVPEKNDNSKMVFDLTDSLTLYVGGDRKKTIPIFGGYIIGYDLDDDTSGLTLSHLDTMMDLYREPVYANYYIGVAPTEGQTNPSLQFSGLFEMIRHLCLTNSYWINPAGLTLAYGFIKNFGNYQDFETIGTSGFLKQWDKRNGYPAPGLKLTYDSVPIRCASQTTSAYANLYSPEDSLEEGPFNAKTHNVLAFNYFASNKSSDVSKNMQFNVRVNMHKSGQTPEEAVNYIIMFSGKAGQSNVIGSVAPVYNGVWQVFKFDLGAAFNSYAASDAYYINSVDLVDNVDVNQVNNRLYSSIWIDNVLAYATDYNHKFSSEQEAIYPYEVLKAAAEKTGFAAYMRYGPQRRNDILVMAPLQNEESSEVIKENVNVLRVYNKNYAPKETISNKVLRYYSKTDETTGRAYVEDLESLRRYGPFQNFENLSDVTGQLDADIEAQRYLQANSGGLVTFSLDIKGSTLLNPAQYVVADIPGHYLKGNHAIASIIHDINLENNLFKTQIDLGAPSRRFRFMLVNVRRQLKSLLSYDSRTQYNTKAMARLGFTSPGGFIKTY